MRLFLYGVLLGSVAEGAVRDLLRGLGPGQPATTRGLLYAVLDDRGIYPVLVPGEGIVHGMMHEAGLVDLTALDRFEGVDPQDPHAGEYRRQPIDAELPSGGTVTAEAYLYNLPLTPALVPIAHGDFARWLRETGHRPFAS